MLGNSWEAKQISSMELPMLVALRSLTVPPIIGLLQGSSMTGKDLGSTVQQATYVYCDGFGASYATIFRIHGVSDVDVATQRSGTDLEFPKQPNCCETEATENATVREGVFCFRRKHCI
jgi:hypothetical protein